jgi:hypothetical protein
MHNKGQLWTASVRVRAASLERAGYKVMKRLSTTKSGIALAHVLVAVEGKVWDFVGPATAVENLEWTHWLPEECPAAHQVFKWSITFSAVKTCSIAEIIRLFFFCTITIYVCMFFLI